MRQRQFIFVILICIFDTITQRLLLLILIVIKKLLGYEVKFLTDTDKHGEAEKNNLMPMDYVNSTVESTKKLWVL